MTFRTEARTHLEDTTIESVCVLGSIVDQSFDGQRPNRDSENLDRSTLAQVCLVLAFGCVAPNPESSTIDIATSPREPCETHKLERTRRPISGIARRTFRLTGGEWGARDFGHGSANDELGNGLRLGPLGLDRAHHRTGLTRESGRGRLNRGVERVHFGNYSFDFGVAPSECGVGHRPSKKKPPLACARGGPALARLDSVGGATGEPNERSGSIVPSHTENSYTGSPNCSKTYRGGRLGQPCGQPTRAHILWVLCGEKSSHDFLTRMRRQRYSSQTLKTVLCEVFGEGVVDRHSATPVVSNRHTHNER